MNAKPTSTHRGGLLLTIALGICLPVLGYFGLQYLEITKGLWLLTGKVKDGGHYLVYLPAGLEPGKPTTLVFALSPGADAMGMLSTWAPIAEKHRWIVAASKEFRNGIDFLPSMQEVERELSDVQARYPTLPNRVIFTGLSGGGMGSHAIAKFYPGTVNAIVINTGMMEAGMMTADYPNSKLAVFLASPTDFRYNEMKRDRNFLESHQWQTTWIEFEGGHTLAPTAAYEQAAAWLEKTLP